MINSEPSSIAESTPTSLESTESVVEAEPTKEKEGVETAEPTPKERHKSLRSALRESFRSKGDSAVEKETPNKEEPKEVTGEPPAHHIPPLQDMNAQERAFWDKLPNETKQYLSRRHQNIEQERSRFIQQMREREALYPELEALKDVREEYQREGINPADIVKRSIAWDKFFKSDPVNAARQYLEAYGVDPAELAQAPSENGAQLPKEYLDKMQTLEQKLAAIEAEKESERQSSLVSNHANTINSFIASKPLLNDPALPAELAAEMEQVVGAVRAQYPLAPIADILNEAYRQFEASPRVQARSSATKQAQDAEKAKAEAQKARKASRSITGGPGSGSPAKKANSIRDSLRQNFFGDA